MTYTAQQSNKNIIFIVGIGRSGTSLLQTILNRHSQIGSSQETAFVRDFIIKNRKIHEKDLINSKLKRLNICKKNLVMPISSIEFYDKYVNSTNALFFLDKDPRLIESIKSLKKIFPNSKVICIYRNPLDVIHSKINAEWSKKNSIYKNILISAIQHKLFKKSSAFCLTLKYEDLVINPKAEVRKIIDYLKINFEENILTPKYIDERLVANEEMQWKANTLKPIDSAYIGKGGIAFSDFQQSLIYEANKDIFNRFNYSKPSTRLRLLNIFLIKIISYVVNFLASAYVKVFYKKF